MIISQLKFGLSAVWLLSLLLVFASPTISSAEIKRIGYILPLTGDAAIFGQEVRRGLEIAKTKLAVGGNNIELLFEDEKCLPKEATTAWQTLAVTKSVPIIIGPGCAGSIVATAPLAESRARPLIALWDAGRAVEGSGQDVFSIGFDSESEGRIIAEHLLSKGLKKVSVIWEEDKFAEVVKDAFVQRYQAGAGEVVAQAAVGAGEQALASTITRLIAARPDALFLSPAYSAVATLKAIRNLGFKGPVFGQDTLGVPGVVEAAGQSIEGIIFADIRIPEDRSAVREFKREYITRFSAEPDSLTFASFGYDSLMLAAQLPADPAQQLEKLWNLRWSGVLPFSSFKEGRMLRLPPSLFQVSGGKIVPYTGG